MKILVLGNGGREHALAFILRREGHRVTVAPGNAGMVASGLATCPMDIRSVRDAVKVCRSLEVDLVVVGPEDPLALGVADALRAEGFRVVGPDRDGSRLESSKAFAKRAMTEAHVPTARAVLARDEGDLVQALAALDGDVVLKADALAQGKGVVVPENREEAVRAGRDLLERFGPLIVEERLAGEEVSLMVLTDGVRVTPLPLGRDHKRRHEGGTGPMTGGMGAVAPIGDMRRSRELVEETILPLLDWLRWARISYRGFLYAGLMLTPAGPRVLEFNVRLGDPEAEVLLPLIKEGMAERLLGLAEGRLEETPLPLSGRLACGVVVASAGYPVKPRTGQQVRLEGDIGGEEHLFWAGVAGDGPRLTVAGGRVAVAVGQGTSRDEAKDRAYSLAGRVRFEDAAFRKDVDWPAGDPV